MKDKCTVQSFGVQKLAEFNIIEWNALEFDQQRTQVHAKQNHINLGLKLKCMILILSIQFQTYVGLSFCQRSLMQYHKYQNKISQSRSNLGLIQQSKNSVRLSWLYFLTIPTSQNPQAQMNFSKSAPQFQSQSPF